MADYTIFDTITYQICIIIFSSYIIALNMGILYKKEWKEVDILCPRFQHTLTTKWMTWAHWNIVGYWWNNIMVECSKYISILSKINICLVPTDICPWWWWSECWRSNHWYWTASLIKFLTMQYNITYKGVQLQWSDQKRQERYNYAIPAYHKSNKNILNLFHI